MSVPFLDVGAAYRELEHPIDAAIARVLRSGRFILGPKSSPSNAALGPTRVRSTASASATAWRHWHWRWRPTGLETETR